MHAENTYNGWKNYATRVNLEICDNLISHLSNDIKNKNTEPFADVADLVRHLEDEVDEIISNFGKLDDDKSADLALAYARAFLADVDWWEIAETAERNYPHMFEQDDDNDQ